MVKNIYKKSTPHRRIKHYDLLVLGAGPAGLTAALYASRYNLDVAVVGKLIGGTANLAEEVHNWPGYVGSGKDLMKKFKEQGEGFGARFLQAEIDNVEKDNDGFVIELKHDDEKKIIHGKALIVAFGTERRKLDLEGEDEFVGKGVSYCATCDGQLFRGKVVAVVGGADSAAKSALYLADVAKKVYLIHRRDELKCEPTLLGEIKKKRKIKVYYNSIITKIDGGEKVEEIKVEQTEDEKTEKFELDVNGLFIEIGGKPMTEIVGGLGLKFNNSHIVTTKEMKTSVDGIFAAGDATAGYLKQIVTAAGDGAMAAKSAYDYLRFEYEKEKA
ncbi:thioredoxin-disulfide reductase [Candidatus Pacearchaeota archaeon]|nr:thioredoxin-disulfide reductase [Candidatus Pacearchaeota archaeon]